MVAQPSIPHEALATFCKKWRIEELALFGSVLRPDFNENSDMDVLVRFDPGAPWSHWEFSDMSDELQRMFGRRVDLVEERSLVNPFRRHAIESTKRVVYASR